MKRFTSAVYRLALVSLVPLAASAQETLPEDVYPDSRNRLPAINPDSPQGAAGTRLHGSGVAVRRTRARFRGRLLVAAP